MGREVVVELKNDLSIRGTLRSVDQYLNIKLENTRVVDQDKYPHMVLSTPCQLNFFSIILSLFLLNDCITCMECAETLLTNDLVGENMESIQCKLLKPCTM